ncbi:sensor histidine kinase [Maribellus maritimus]|uniref:sensor histidine kinase n=1 Tax=Maribellus maritimus TaxID=2870838 RepID=UPI001EEB1CB0|nr:sensor histidine kinase [Maribellus maritimus]MCG6187019.1 sensor histidine kinase [Maribellus maritimus]
MPETGITDITTVYYIGSLGMIILAVAIFFFFVAYQKRLLKKELELTKVKSDQQEEILRNTISAQEKERKRIARDLHDEVGAMLSVVKLNVGQIEKKSESEKAKTLAGETKSYLDEVITQVRRISRDLLPPSLEKLGLSFAIQELVNWINKSGKIEIEYWSTGEPVRFEIKKELAVFRIVQEIVNNALKHAEPSRIQIKTRFLNSSLAVSISDDGKGFDLNEKLETGLGLKNLESRSGTIGAKFKMRSIPGKGTLAIIFANF